MKKIIVLLLTILALFPINVFALQDNYNTKNLEETLTSENIKHDLSKYQESDDQVKIYMFRGDGCGYCQKFLTFLNSIVPEYGKYFKLVSYEVWYDDANEKLMQEVASFLGETVGGVPFIIIGDQIFPGYSSTYDENIKAKIKEEYEKKDEKYDVMEELRKHIEEQNKPDHSTAYIIIFNLIFLILATGILLFVHYKNTKLLEEKIVSLQMEIKEMREPKGKENKKIDKKENKKN